MRRIGGSCTWASGQLHCHAAFWLDMPADMRRWVHCIRHIKLPCGDIDCSDMRAEWSAASVYAMAVCMVMGDAMRPWSVMVLPPCCPRCACHDSPSPTLHRDRPSPSLRHDRPSPTLHHKRPSPLHCITHKRPSPPTLHHKRPWNAKLCSDLEQTLQHII